MLTPHPSIFELTSLLGRSNMEKGTRPQSPIASLSSPRIEGRLLKLSTPGFLDAILAPAKRTNHCQPCGFSQPTNGDAESIVSYPKNLLKKSLHNSGNYCSHPILVPLPAKSWLVGSGYNKRHAATVSPTRLVFKTLPQFLFSLVIPVFCTPHNRAHSEPDRRTMQT